MTHAQHPNPLDVLKRIRVNLPTGEGVPSKNEGGGGVFYLGARGTLPLVGLDKVQGVIRLAECPVRAHSLR
ncbi:hypothetical protein CN448_30580 [Bacillus cereus]|nr:hypothetical protein CN448_30580 [Bacillus cereus]